jgi:hypothetical protein
LPPAFFVAFFLPAFFRLFAILILLDMARSTSCAPRQSCRPYRSFLGARVRAVF